MASYKKVILQSDNISELTNDAGYITSVGSVTWGDISGKPSIFMHDYATVTGNPTFAGTNSFTGPNTFTGNTTFTNVNPIIYSSSAFNGTPKLTLKTFGSGDSHLYGALMLKRQGTSGYNSQLEFQTSIYNNNLRTVMTLNSAGSLHLDGTVYANGVIGLNSGGFAIGSIASYNRIDFQSGKFRTLHADGSIAPLQAGDTTLSTLTVGNALINGTAKVINSTPHLYVGDNDADNSGTWDANIQLDSHANARLRIQQRSDAKNLELWAHGGYEPLIQATDSANYLRLGVGGAVGLELGKYSVHLKKATYVESLRADNSSGLITIYNQGYGSKGNLELNNITGVESTFTTRVNTGQIRFTNSSQTSFNHLNVSQWHTAYTWGNHADAGYLTSHQSLANYTTKGSNISQFANNSGYATQSWVNSQGFLTSQTDSQTLSLSGNELSISNGNKVQLPSYSNLTTGDVQSYIEGDNGIRSVRFDFQSYDTHWDNDATNSKQNNNPMSIKLWDSYNSQAKSGTDPYGTILDIYGRSGHQRNQFFMGSTGYVYHRSTFYGQDGWQNWYKFWSTKNLEDNVVQSLRSNYNKWLTSHQDISSKANLHSPTFTGHIRLSGSGRTIGGFGAVTTAGTTDWNHDSNAISGQGYTLLLGNATNGHGFDTDYYHPFNFEYARNDGYGNMTQLAVPYSGNGAFAFRSRYSGNWTSWRRIIDTGIISNYADKTPSWVPSSDPGYLTSSSTINASKVGGYSPITTGRNNTASGLMMTDGNGYANFGWINTTSGRFTGTPNRIYASSDQYMRYMTLEDFRARIFDVSGGGDSIGTVDGQNFHIKTNSQYRISITNTGDIGLLGPTILKTNNTKLHGITSGSATIGLIGVRSDNWIELGHSGYNLTSKSPFYAEADAFIHKSTPQLELKDTANNTRGYIGINNGVLKVGSKDNVNLHFQTNGTDRGYFLANGTFVTLGAIYSGTVVPNSGGSYDLGTDSARWRNIHTNAIYVDGRNVTGGTIDQIGQGVGAYNWGNHANAGYYKAGSTLDISSIKNRGSYTELNDLAITKKLYVAFDHGVANQKADIVIPNTHDSGRFWGEIIVTISSGYSHENASGSLKVCYALGLNHNGAQYTNSSMVMVSEGRTPYNFALDDAFRWDDTNKHWYLPLQHSTSTGNQAYIQIEAKATNPNYIENLQTAYVTSVYTTNTNVYPHRGYAYNNSFDIRGPNLLVGSYLNADKTTNVGSTANGITIAGEHAPTLSLWDLSSSGFHSHVYQVGSDMTIRSSGTLSLQIAGGTRAVRINSDKNVTFDGQATANALQSIGNTYVSGALYTDSLNRQTSGSAISVNTGLTLTQGGIEVSSANAYSILKNSSSNYYRTYINDSDHNLYTDYNGGLIRAYSPVVGWDFRGAMSIGGNVTLTGGDLKLNIGRIRSYASSGALTIMNGDSGSWGVLNSRGVNLGDWYRQPSYGEIAVGAYNFHVFKGDSGSSSTLFSVNQAGVLTTTGNVISGSHLITSNRLYLDGGSDTYIEESSANTIDIHNGIHSARFETGRTLFYLPLQPQSDVAMSQWKTFKQGGYHHKIVTPVFDPRNVGGSGQARWEVARIFIDRVNWNTTGMTKVKVYERYWYAGAWKEFEINFGYSNANQGVCKLVDCGGFGTTIAEFTVTTGVPTAIPNGTANKYYIPIYVRSKSYVQVQAEITSTHNIASDWDNSHYGIVYAMNNTNLNATEDSFTVNQDAQKIIPFSTSGTASQVYFDNTWVTASANMQVQSNLYTNSIQHNTSSDMIIGNKAHGIRIENGVYLDVSSNNNTPGIRLMDSSYNIHGYLYANNTSEVGLLDADGHWGYKHKKDDHHQWRINNTQRMYLDNYQMDVYSNQFKVEGGNPRIIAKGSSNGYVNGAFVTSSIDINRGGGLFMHDRGNQNEWFCGRPYSNNDQFIIARNTGVADHSGTTAQAINEMWRIDNNAYVHSHVNISNSYRLKGTNNYPRFERSGDDAYIGTNSQNTAFYLYDNGNARVVGSLTAYQGNSNEWNTAYGWGDHSKAGYSTKSSDIRLKTNISTIETPLDKISKLRGVTFDWKEHTTKNTVDTGGGVIAQEVEKVMPEFVHDIGNGSGMKTVDYNGLIGVLIESVKELKEQVNKCKCNCNCKGE